jgi:excisionase family DNA binding protein
VLATRLRIYGAKMDLPNQTELLAQLANTISDNLERNRPTLPRVAYSLEEIATMVGVSKRVIENQLNARLLRGKRVGRSILITHRELERWLNG